MSSVAELRGRLEGKVVASAVSGGALARFLIAVGASVREVPEFARDLGRMNFRQFVDLNGELEMTAKMGYRRILALAGRLEGNEAFLAEFGYAFAYDVARILCEENFHEDAFRVMGSWIGGDGRSFAHQSASVCARTLHELCERHLSISVMRDQLQSEWAVHGGTVRGTPSRKPPNSDFERKWLSDGGLGAVFQEYGLEMPIANAEEAMFDLWG
jgi:hypothetical protein